jgi:large subunit ribosomal protein L28
MSKICQITGKRLQRGNNVSHSNIKTKREFLPNLCSKKFWFAEENRWITLKVSASGIRTINKIGLKAALERAQAYELVPIF